MLRQCRSQKGNTKIVDMFLQQSSGSRPSIAEQKDIEELPAAPLREEEEAPNIDEEIPQIPLEQKLKMLQDNNSIHQV